MCSLCTGPNRGTQVLWRDDGHHWRAFSAAHSWAPRVILRALDVSEALDTTVAARVVPIWKCWSPTTRGAEAKPHGLST